MSDIVADAMQVVTMSGNPLTHGEDDESKLQEQENTDLVVCPDFFGRIRALYCQADGSPRLYVWLLPRLWPAQAAVHIWMAIANGWGSASDLNEQTAPHIINNSMFGIAGTFPIVFTAQVYGAIAPLHTDTHHFTSDLTLSGSLVRLGAGSKKVSTSDLRTVQRWCYALFPVAAFLALMSLVFWSSIIASEEGDIRKISVASMIIVYMAVGLPSMVIWYIAMKVGVCLVPVYTISLSAQKTSMEKKQGTLR